MAHRDLSKDRAVKAIKPTSGRVDYFDTSLPGFTLRVTPRGVKTWCVFYRVQAGTDKGVLRRMANHTRYPALGCAQARKWAGDIFVQVGEGKDPAKARQIAKHAKPDKRTYRTFGDLVGRGDPGDGSVTDTGYIGLRAKPRQRTWKETERTLRVNCAEWLDRPLSGITKQDAYDLLDGFVADGHGPKARVTLGWLKTMYRWAAKRDIVPAPIMDAVEIDFEARTRERRYSDAEVKAIWKAANSLNPIEGGFLKLSLLLGMRKGELAGMRRGELDDPQKPTLWTVPNERVKQKKTGDKDRVYIVPLPRLAQRIIRGLPKADPDLLFPGRHKGKAMVPGTPLQTKIKTATGIEDFYFHACRDTVASWLQDQGHSEYERGLVLNHAGTTVTARYSHGYPVDLKRSLLDEWAAHVAGLIEPRGATVLR